MSYLDRFTERDLSVVVSELLVATADASDPLLDETIGDVLATLRRKLGLDVVFVSEFVDGRRVFRFVDHSGPETVIRPGESNPLEETFCLRVVDGRLPGLVHDVGALPADTDLPKTPVRVGAHLSTPILLKNGATYGTLCCFSAKANPDLRDADLETLQLCAKLVARKIEIAGRDAFVEPPDDWALEPMEPVETKGWTRPPR